MKRWRTIKQEVAHAELRLETMAHEASITMPTGGIKELRLVPCPAPTPPDYGLRIGAWAEVEDFMREWRGQGKDWVNISLLAYPGEPPYLCYEVPDRGEIGLPLDYPGPSINLHGPAIEPPRYTRHGT